jgi:hypothetical protein
VKILLEYAFDYEGAIETGVWKTYNSLEDQEIPVVGQSIPLQIYGEEHIVIVTKVWPGVPAGEDICIKIDCQPTGVGEAGG